MAIGKWVQVIVSALAWGGALVVNGNGKWQEKHTAVRASMIVRWSAGRGGKGGGKG
jgi:hypothetical protein